MKEEFEFERGIELKSREKTQYDDLKNDGAIILTGL